MWNIKQKHSGRLMLGMSVETRELAQHFIDTHYTNEYTTRLNKGRVANGYPPLPLDDYEVIETDIEFTF